ncbi:MAG: hypothetical protein V5A64_04825 [Candidatus Thermoplasmatota archaeon]
MSEVEVIYLKPSTKTERIHLSNNDSNSNNKEENTGLISQVTTQVNIRNNNKKSNKKPKKQEPKIHHKKSKSRPKRNTKKLISALIVFAIILPATGAVAANQGYLPIKAILPIHEPVGARGSIDVSADSQEYEQMGDLPDLSNIKSKIFISDANMKTVMNNYEYKLKEDGYHLEYKGIITKKGITFNYYGFTKGITVVGILITEELGEKLGHESVVLYTTGNIFDYKEVKSWCKSNI